MLDWNSFENEGKRNYRETRVYQQLFNREFYLIAYGKLYRNEGATTKGVTDEIVAAMSLEKIATIIAALRTERYRWTPSGVSISRRSTRPTNAPSDYPFGATNCFAGGCHAATEYLADHF